MDELIRSLSLSSSASSMVTVWSVLIGCYLSGILSMGIGLLYRRVQSESTYSQSLVHSFVVMSMITALIMLIIGSSIARAFSLVGALSIIRFRTAIKSPLDISFLFFTMAIGMACGTRFYAVAIAGFLAISSLILLIHKLNFGSYGVRSEYLLSVVMHMDKDFETELRPALEKHFQAFSLTYSETIRQGTLREVVYSVKPKVDSKDREIVDDIRELNDNLKVSYRTVRHAIEVP